MFTRAFSRLCVNLYDRIDAFPSLCSKSIVILPYACHVNDTYVDMFLINDLALYVIWCVKLGTLL